jgi:hypothetical protein
MRHWPGNTRIPAPVLGDLALHPAEIEARLRDITVYTLVDTDNQFILVSGGGAGDGGKDEQTAKQLVRAGGGNSTCSFS